MPYLRSLTSVDAYESSSSASGLTAAGGTYTFFAFSVGTDVLVLSAATAAGASAELSGTAAFFGLCDAA